MGGGGEGQTAHDEVGEVRVEGGRGDDLVDGPEGLGAGGAEGAQDLGEVGAVVGDEIGGPPAQGVGAGVEVGAAGGQLDGGGGVAEVGGPVQRGPQGAGGIHLRAGVEEEADHGEGPRRPAGPGGDQEGRAASEEGARVEGPHVGPPLAQQVGDHPGRGLPAQNFHQVVPNPGPRVGGGWGCHTLWFTD